MTSATDPDSHATQNRLIDEWFPVAAVDEACGSPAGSGRSEKALFTWFASRPIAQARAAVLTSLLPADAPRGTVNRAITDGNQGALTELARLAGVDGKEKPPAVLDCFSGRGIIPLEAARLGLRTVGIDLSPVAALASRVLADWPLRDWSGEKPSPFTTKRAEDAALFADVEPRLLTDVKALLAEVGERVAAAVAPYYPPNSDGSQPWGTLWALTIPCDACGRRFPVIGSLVLRHPEHKRDDPGQALELAPDEHTGICEVRVVDGTPTQAPTFVNTPGKSGKVARCPFRCGKVHTLDTLKAKGQRQKDGQRQYRDEPLAVADIVEVRIPGKNAPVERKVFREVRDVEREAIDSIVLDGLEPIAGLSAVPDEPIPAGNEDTVRPSAYGFRTYGELMNPRQTLQFVETVKAIRDCHAELGAAGITSEYAEALASYASANFVRQMKHATRGAKLRAHGKSNGASNNRVQADHIFSKESKVPFEFDHFEAGPAAGPGTWSSIAKTGNDALHNLLSGPLAGAEAASFRRASASALPLRDNSIDAVLTDPPYYNMIDYADVSDLFYVWLRRALKGIAGDLFDEPGDPAGVQDKREEIIVKRGGTDGEHRVKDWYEDRLAASFREMRRVLKPGGTLAVVFGHSDPDAWRRLLGALHDAGFVVTSAWPARTEGSSTGVASIKVTVTIGCRVAPDRRPNGTVVAVEREIADAVAEAVSAWENDGLALSDQLMACYGPTMEVVGRYKQVLATDGSTPDLDRFLAAGRAAVRDAQDIKVDRLPLETFDAATRFALFWLRAFKRTTVAKGEALFHAQADVLRLDEVRGDLLEDGKGGYKLTLQPQRLRIDERTPVFELVRAMAAAWPVEGTEGAGRILAAAARTSDDQHVWAVVDELSRQLPASDKVRVALEQCQRNRRAIQQTAARQHTELTAAAAQTHLELNTASGEAP